MHDVRIIDPSKRFFVGTIKMSDIKTRKTFAPLSQLQRNKKVYTRKHKHPTEHD